jgi:hypothetical protein
MHPVLGRELVEREQDFVLPFDRRNGFGPLPANSKANSSIARSAFALFSTSVISRIAFLARGCMLFGRASRTAAVL